MLIKLDDADKMLSEKFSIGVHGTIIAALRALPTVSVTDGMVEVAARAMCWQDTEIGSDCEKACLASSKCLGDGVAHYRREARTALEAALGTTVSDGWEDIAINPPPANEVVLMCWYHGHWEVWEYEAGCYETGQRIGGYSNVHFHGQATHWRPLPAPPSEEK